MKIYLPIIGVLYFLITGPISSNIYADEIKPGHEVTIITLGVQARLCPLPGCGPDQHIVRIPEGTVLTIEGTEIFEIGSFKVKWFEVIYQNHRGWISIYDTDLARR